jgi:methyltransferase, FkbM family
MTEMIKCINKNQIIPRWVKRFDKLISTTKWPKFHKIVMKYASHTDRFFFIEIGSNDGIIHDPIYRYVTQYHWSGILVEPVRYYFNKLKANYNKNDNLIFENVAISNKDELRDFYRIKEGLNYLPDWCKGLGSFYLNILLKHKWVIPNITDYIIKEKVKCVSFGSLLKKHDVKKIDLLLIDTEGYDYEIIKQIDFKNIRPSIMVYEHKHIDKKDRKDCERLLKSNSYSLMKHFGNTLACLPH